ncbi:hypothetical protein PB1_16314 [Bacillus methanolicus PB1]|uniref:Uncharacterized protein n=1 Tax=Bacillus methanolicus PB1 TaxID=997296 RepID=I3DY17_BACMT|nr:hypothetical protein [Bacillus methanolicus]EIJ79138.1 hypothetical protein PB1_16314 [Bacillus methanolicus PB1]
MQLELFKEVLEDLEIEHCLCLQEMIQKHFGHRKPQRDFRITAYHIKDKKKFIARIGGSLFFCELTGNKKFPISYARKFHGGGDNLYKWIEYIDRFNNRVDLLNLSYW